MTEALPGLRCVIAWSDCRNLCSVVGDELRAIVPADELRQLGDDAFIVHTALQPEDRNYAAVRSAKTK